MNVPAHSCVCVCVFADIQRHFWCALCVCVLRVPAKENGGGADEAKRESVCVEVQLLR